MLDLGPIKELLRDYASIDRRDHLRAEQRLAHHVAPLIDELERLRAQLAGAKPPAYTYRVRICPHCEGVIVVGVPHACKGVECARCGAAKPCWCGAAGMA